MENDHEEELGFVMLTYLSDGEFLKVQQIAAKDQITDKEFWFVMQLAGRTTKLPLIPPPPGLEVRIRQHRGKFSIVRVDKNLHLQN